VTLNGTSVTSHAAAAVNGGSVSCLCFASRKESRFYPLGPGNLREATVIREHLLDPVLPHHTQVNAVPGGQDRMILKKPARRSVGIKYIPG
jgi:hypothetical protein